jgi:hypothetical protein
MVDMLGAYGWEKIAIAFMENGHFLAGNTDHYAIGSYTAADGAMQAHIRVTQLGTSRTIFGETEPEMDLKMVGTIETDSMIIGRVFPADDEAFDVKFRLSRLGDIR